MEEKQYEIKLINGKKVTVGLSSAVYDRALIEGNFVKLRFSDRFPSRIICIWQSLGGPVIIMFEVGDDDVYRVAVDISLMADDIISIEKKMKDGISRRTDIKICY
ncbi:MAG TPA: hypothetical protein PLE28_02515 [bacterium]|nr:hypothetical protein [bacterium]